jgi:serine/threonine-protein phosphatase PP1 catalytic subunit
MSCASSSIARKQDSHAATRGLPRLVLFFSLSSTEIPGSMDGSNWESEHRASILDDPPVYGRAVILPHAESEKLGNMQSAELEYSTNIWLAEYEKVTFVPLQKNDGYILGTTEVNGITHPAILDPRKHFHIQGVTQRYDEQLTKSGFETEKYQTPKSESGPSASYPELGVDEGSTSNSLAATTADNDIDQMIRVLRNHKGTNKSGKQCNLAYDDVCNLVNKAVEALKTQPTLLRLEAPIRIVGDVHGQYQDLLQIFEKGGDPSESTPYLFLGDYVDRGKNGVETICLLLAYKVKYPSTFHLLRGNHEAAEINRIYGFYDACKIHPANKGSGGGPGLWKEFNKVFGYLPLAAVVSDKIFCAHAGLSPQMTNVDKIDSVTRPLSVPDEGLVCDLLWSDPESDKGGWADNDRGISYTFGEDVVRTFCETNDFDLIVRAHQVVEDGYEFFADKSLLTVFSAPKYMGETDNDGAFIEVYEDLNVKFHSLFATREKVRIHPW